MYIPMWLLVLLILFAAAGVWALIFVAGFIDKMIDSALRMPPVRKEQIYKDPNKNNGDPTL